MSVTHDEARNVSSRPRTLLLSLMAMSGLWFAGCRTTPLQSRESPSEPVIVALRDAAIINLTDGSVTPHQTVVIEGDRIKVVGSVNKVRVPPRAQIVEARGRFLIPGLWDMHVHSVDEDPSEGYRAFFPLFVANGITGVRDMWGDTKLAATLRRRIEEGHLLGPRLIVAGNLVDGSPPVWPGSTVVRSEEEGRAIVEALVREGAGFIKVYSRLTADTYFAISRRANELGIPFAGHVPFAVRAADASTAGQRSMEHLYGVMEACSPEEQLLMEMAVQRAASSGEKREPDREYRHKRFSRLLITQDDKRC